MPDDFCPEILPYITGLEDQTGYFTRHCRYEFEGKVIDLGYAYKAGEDIGVRDRGLREAVWAAGEKLRFGLAKG